MQVAGIAQLPVPVISTAMVAMEVPLPQGVVEVVEVEKVADKISFRK